MAKAKKHSSARQMNITWHFFVPGAVGGAIAFIFGSGLQLAVEVFVVVVVATWVIGKYDPR
jgi:Flp pilus assembly protein TadB